MNITFMIGNGFDLQLGLKTRYIDFYNYYIAKNNNDMIAKSINENYDLWSDLEVGLGEFTSTLSNNDIESFLDSKRNLESQHDFTFRRRERHPTAAELLSTCRTMPALHAVVCDGLGLVRVRRRTA